MPRKLPLPMFLIAFAQTGFSPSQQQGKGVPYRCTLIKAQSYLTELFNNDAVRLPARLHKRASRSPEEETLAHRPGGTDLVQAAGAQQAGHAPSPLPQSCGTHMPTCKPEATFRGVRKRGQESCICCDFAGCQILQELSSSYFLSPFPPHAHLHCSTAPHRRSPEPRGWGAPGPRLCGGSSVLRLNEMQGTQGCSGHGQMLFSGFAVINSKVNLPSFQRGIP